MQKDTDSLLLRPIAYARNGFTDKFGIPRQSRPDSQIETRIVLEPAYNHEEALRGIESYSHLWLVWGFSQVPATNEVSLTVRPPRLGGNRRVGVFATRSPFRPNPLGITSVRLIRVESPQTEENAKRWQLIVAGADVLDGTPIYDIKPYLPYSDAHTEATNGLAENTHDYHLRVLWGDEDDVFSTLSPDKVTTWTKAKEDLTEILSQDPRPAYQHDPDRIYGLDYAGWNIQFRVQKNTLYVLKVTSIRQ